MRRDKKDISLEILKFAGDYYNKTQIVYATNINSAILNRHIPVLIENGLMEKSGERYKTTEKGKKLMEDAKEVLDVFQ